jgi:hypothetical protein
VTGLISLRNMKSVLLKLWEIAPLAKCWSVTASVIGGGLLREILYLSFGFWG